MPKKMEPHRDPHTQPSSVVWVEGAALAFGGEVNSDGTRAENLRAGQRVGNGRIISVSHGLDLDTGMFVVKTRDVPDGLHYAEFTANGFFVPLYAIHDDIVFVVRDGIATPRAITIGKMVDLVSTSHETNTHFNLNA